MFDIFDKKTMIFKNHGHHAEHGCKLIELL
jgi:hypothetical protein